MNLEDKNVKLLPQPIRFTMPMTPGLSLYEMELATGHIRLVQAADYSREEILNGVKKNYEFTSDNSYLYIEARDARHAKKKFTRFFKDRKAKLKINETSKT